MFMLKTLSSRLTLTLLLLFVSVMGVVVFSTYQSGLLWQDRVNQSLYRGLVASISREMKIDNIQKIDLADIKSSFGRLLGRDLALDAHLLNGDGKILAATSGAERGHVDSEALGEFFAIEPDFPVYGTDPNSESALKIFSAAKISDDLGQMGYLYVVVGEERYDSIIDKLLHHNCIKLLSRMGIASGVVVILLGWILYAAITGPIKRMCLNIDAYEESDFTNLALLQTKRGSDSADVWHLKQTVQRMAEKISEQLRQLQSMDKLRKEQLIQLSHDLKTPIAAQRGYLETLLLASDKINAQKARHFQQQALDNTQILSQRVEGILELARLDNQSHPCQLEVINLSELCADTVQQLESLGLKKGIKLSLNMPLDAIEMMADIAQLQRVLINLIENSFSYTSSGGKVELTMVLLDKGEVRISVSDNGCGIAEDELLLLFEPYHRSSVELPQQHLGLGLAICKKLVSLHDSNLQVQSTPGKGSNFYFDLQVCCAWPMARMSFDSV